MHYQKESTLCTFKEFPDHPQVHHHNNCNQVRMKNVKSSKISLYPRLIYCYCSAIESLKNMIGSLHVQERETPEGMHVYLYLFAMGDH